MTSPHPGELVDRLLSQATLDVLPGAAFLASVPDGAVMRWNRRAAMLCGGEQHVPRSIGERLHGAGREPLVARTDPILAALRSASSLQETRAVLDAGDQHIAVSVSIEPIRAADGSPVAALALCQATPSSEAGAVLPEERFWLAEQMPHLIWIADRAGWIFWFNRHWVEFTGVPATEMQGPGWRRVHHPDRVDGVLTGLQRCFETGAPWEDAFPLRAKDGTYRSFLARAVQVDDDRSRPVCWIATHTDVTDYPASDQSRLEAEDRTDRVLAVLAHEMRGPLASLLTAVRLLEAKGRANPEVLRLQSTVLRQSLLLARLVDDLLDIGRLVTGKLQLKRTRAELGSILNQAAEICAPLIDQRRHMLVVAPGREPLHLDVDPARIVQVVCNLLTNAARYMQEGGRIEVSAESGEGMAIIRVRDEGVGIAPEMLNRIFERFVQGEVTVRTPAETGLGIGLWLVKALVELHGGRVEAHSEGIGRGSEFVVRLPLAA